MTESENCHRYQIIEFWAIFAGPRGIFAKLPKILTLLLKLHTKKLIRSYLPVRAIIFGLELKTQGVLKTSKSYIYKTISVTLDFVVLWGNF